MRKLLCTILLLAGLMLPVFSSADDAPSIILAESGTTAPDDGRESLIQEINAFLAVLSEDGFDGVSRDQVIEVHEKYDSLTMAERTNVENFSILKKVEEALHIEYESPENRIFPQEKIGCEYEFGLTEEKYRTGVTVKYMTDTDGNGIVERPGKIVLVSPSGAEVLIQQGMTEITTTSISVNARETSDQVRLDIKQGEAGQWKIKTDNTCYFDVDDYQGMKPEEPTTASEEMSKETNVFESET